MVVHERFRGGEGWQATGPAAASVRLGNQSCRHSWSKRPGVRSARAAGLRMSTDGGGAATPLRSGVVIDQLRIGPDHLRQRLHLQLGAQVGAVCFHGAWRQHQGAADLLVGQARHHQRQHLAFTRRQQGIALARFAPGGVTLAGAHMVAHGVVQRLQQGFVVDRLLQEFGRAGLEGAPAHVHRAVAGQHHHRLVDALLAQQGVQHGQARQAGHAHIQHDGADGLAVKAIQKRLRVCPGLYPQTHGADEHGQCLAHGVVVVHQMDQGRHR